MPFQAIEPTRNAAVQSFVATVDRLFDPRDPTTFWKCASAFDELAKSPVVSEVAEEALRQMMDDPLYAPLRWAMQRLVLMQAESYSLVATWPGQPPDAEDDNTLTTQGGHALIHSKSRAPFRVRYFTVGHVDFSLFDPDVKLELAREETIHPGETLAVDGSKWVLEIEERSDICLLVFVSKPLWPHMWSFDPRTLRAQTIGHAEIRDSQLRVVMQIFGEFGYTESEAMVKKMIEYPVHDVRWDAIKTLFKLNAKEGIGALKRAANDPHPHVRRAAEKSLLSCESRRIPSSGVSR